MKTAQKAAAVAALTGALFVTWSVPAQAQALDGRALISERCTSCHDVTGPAPTTFVGVLNRKAPDLFYAGSKFNRAWLVAWLQTPTIIRRSGVMFLNHVLDEAGKDRIAEETVEPCSANLSRELAETAADHLMTLVNPAMETGVVDIGKKLRKHKAYRLFTKQLPCIGCHRIKFGKKPWAAYRDTT